VRTQPAVFVDSTRGTDVALVDAGGVVAVSHDVAGVVGDVVDQE